MRIFLSNVTVYERNVTSICDQFDAFFCFFFLYLEVNHELYRLHFIDDYSINGKKERMKLVSKTTLFAYITVNIVYNI